LPTLGKIAGGGFNAGEDHLALTARRAVSIPTATAPYVTSAHSYRTYDWAAADALVKKMLG
jgi:hypothetical protein